MDPRDSLLQMEVAAARAVELDDSLAEAHLSLGASVFINQWDWARAEHEISRAIELNPGFSEAYHFRSKIYTALNRFNEAIEADKRANELDPFERPYAMSVVYILARQYDAAILDARSQLENQPENIVLHYELYQAYRRKGDGKEAAQELEKRQILIGDRASAESVRRAYEQGGNKGVIQWQLGDLQKRSSTRYVSPVTLASLHAQLGDREQTVALLEEGYRQHSPLLLWIQCDPAFDFLHSDERYRSIIQRIGLPPAW